MSAERGAGVGVFMDSPQGEAAGLGPPHSPGYLELSLGQSIPGAVARLLLGLLSPVTRSAGLPVKRP